MDTILPRGFYQIICNTPNDLTLSCKGGGSEIFNYWTNGNSKSTKTANRLIRPSTNGGKPGDLYAITTTGKWLYQLKTDTGSVTANFSICKMDGDYTWGNNKWNAYVYDYNNPVYDGYGYQGTFTSDSATFAYSWPTQPTLNNYTCGVTMDDSSYLVTFLMRKNFQPGKYKVRVKSQQGGQCFLSDSNGVVKYYISNTGIASSYDVTSPFITFSGDTFFTATVYKYTTSTAKLSFVSCREPKDPGHITVSRDTACVGDQVTLTADTADGTETQWYKKSCAGTGGLYIGSGASITVTMDTSTTFYVRNRNRTYASGDTTNSLDLYSVNCSSKRIIAVPYPSAPTAPTAQSRCSSGSEIFTFSGVNAGNNGNQVQWSTSSSFTNCQTITSGGTFNDTVSNGNTDTIRLRSKRSDGGCVSSAVVTTAANHANPSPPIAPPSQSVCSDTAYTFVFDSLQVGVGGDSIEWALDSAFSSNITIANNGRIELVVQSNTIDTIWLRTYASATGCRSIKTHVSCRVGFPTQQFYFYDTILYKGAHPQVAITKCLPDVRYDIISDTNVIGSNYGTDDTLLILCQHVDTTEVLAIRAYDTLNHCFRVIDSNIVIHVIPNVVTPEHLMTNLLSDTDANYFEIVEIIDSLLEEEEVEGEVEEFEFRVEYNHWKEYWLKNIHHSGSFRKTFSAMETGIYALDGNCSAPDMGKWRLAGPSSLEGQLAGVALCVWGESNPNAPGESNYDANFLPNKILIGTMGGIWRTQDGGTTWSHVPFVDDSDPSRVLFGLGVSALVVDPTNNDKIFASTRHVNQYDRLNGGVVFSENGGQTWTRDLGINQLLENQFGALYPNAINSPLKIALGPNSNRLYAVALNCLFRRNSDGSWDKIFAHPTSNTIDFRDIKFVPDLSDPNEEIIFLASRFASPIEVWRIVDDNGTVSSQNLTPASLNQNAWDLRVSIPEKNSVYIVGTSGSDTHQMYSEIVTAPAFNSKNLGNALSFVRTFHISCFGTNYCPAWQEFHVSKSKNSSGENILYYGTTSIYRSTDNGVTWPKISGYDGAFDINGTSHGDIRYMQIYHSSETYLDGAEDILFAGTDGGPAILRPNASQFDNLNGHYLAMQSYWGISSSENNCTAAAGGTSHNGLHSMVKGKWGYLEISDAMNCAYDDWVNTSPDNSNHIIWNSGLSTPTTINYRSDFGDGVGGTISQATGLGACASIFNKPIRIHPSTKEFYIGYNELYRIGHNPGNNVLQLDNTPIFNCRPVLTCSDAVPITSFDINTAGSSGDQFCVAYEGFQIGHPENKLFKIVGTTSPVDVSINGIPSELPISEVVTNPNAANEIWVALGGYYDDGSGNFPANTQKVYYSCDGGDTWLDRSEGLPNLGVGSIVYRPNTNDEIYLGTQAGVFKWFPNYTTHDCSEGTDAGHWECFSNGLPFAGIIDLHINDCGNKLLASVAERGMWITDLPEATIAVEDITNSNYTAKSYDYSNTEISHINHDLFILPGATLTITNATLKFNKGRQIVVKPGGKLIVENSTLTDACECTWDGIVVQGNRELEQDLTSNDNSTATSNNQGFVFLDHATIENASNALTVWNTDDGWVSSIPGDPQGGTGGIVRAVNSTFKDNQKAAEFMSYHYSDQGLEQRNKSYFYNCDFITTDDFPSDLGHPHSFISNWDTWGVTALGCNFENKRTDVSENTKAVELGSGIVAIDAGMEVNDYTPSLGIGGSNLVRSSFKNLNHGVLIAGVNSPHSNKILHAKFENCLRGIRNEGVDLATFAGNEFKLGGNPAIDPDDVFFQYDEGIILHQCSGFTVEQNSFENENDPTRITIGVRADATGSADNVIRKNDFNSVYVGNVANRQNQNNLVFPPVGLGYECNTDVGNILFDFCVSNSLSNPLYGVRTTQGLTTVSAANSFSHNNGVEPESDFYNDAVDLTYYYFDNSDLPQFFTTASVNPLSPNGIGENACSAKFAFPTEEEPNVGGWMCCTSFGENVDDYKASKAALQLYKGQYMALIDGGNTQARMAMVDTGSNGNRLRDTLLAYAPNLSSYVLEGVSRKNAILGDTGQYQVMKANAEGLTYEIISYLENRVGLPSWMIDSLIAAKNIISYRTYLHDSAVYYAQQKEYANYNVLRLIEDDTLGFDINIYRQWLDSSDALWAKQLKVGSYLFSNNIDTAFTLLAYYDSTTFMNGEDSSALLSFNNFVSNYAQWIGTDSSFMNLDSIHLEELREIAVLDEHLKGTNMARGVLNFFYDSAYFTPAELPEIEFAKREVGETFIKNGASEAIPPKDLRATLKFYPNPGQNSVTIEYGKLEGNCTLLVVNTLGMLVDEIILKDVTGKLTLNTVVYSNGIYLASIQNEDKTLVKDKFIILK